MAVNLVQETTREGEPWQFTYHNDEVYVRSSDMLCFKPQTFNIAWLGQYHVYMKLISVLLLNCCI